MSRLSIVLTQLFFITFALTFTTQAAVTRQVRLHKVDGTAANDRTEMRIRPADTTGARRVVPQDTAVWRVDGWVAGSELYKSYLDPSKAHLTCVGVWDDELLSDVRGLVEA